MTAFPSTAKCTFNHENWYHGEQRRGGGGHERAFAAPPPRDDCVAFNGKMHMQSRELVSRRAAEWRRTGRTSFRRSAALRTKAVRGRRALSPPRSAFVTAPLPGADTIPRTGTRYAPEEVSLAEHFSAAADSRRVQSADRGAQPRADRHPQDDQRPHPGGGRRARHLGARGLPSRPRELPGAHRVQRPRGDPGGGAGASGPDRAGPDAPG